MNIFSKSLRILAKLKPIPFFRQPKLYSCILLPFSETSSSSQIKCAHKKSDFYNLLAVSKKNQQLILETLKKYDDKNYVCFLLQMVFELNLGNPEFLEVLVPKFLSLDMKNPTILLNLYRGLPKAEPPLLQKVIDKLQNSIEKNLPLFRTQKLLEIVEITKLLPDPSRNQFLEKVNKFLLLSSAERTATYLKAIGLDNLIETENATWELKKVDFENKEYRIINKLTNQEIILCGCDPYPNENLDHVLNLIDSEKNQINLLVVQDIPILDKKFKGSEYSLERKSSKKLAEYFKKKDFKDELEGGLLEWYAKSFINNEYFVMNLKEGKIYQKVNSQLYIPSELGSTVVRFALNANQEKKCKVILADFPLIFQIAFYNRNLPIEHCRDLLNVCNFVNLLEKSVYSHTTYLLGCHKCNPSENFATLPSRLPRDYLSILMGDTLLPNSQKIEYIANKIMKTLVKNPEQQKILVTISSPLVEEILKKIYVFTQETRLGSMEPFSEMMNLKKSLEVFQEVDKDHQILEKTVIFEILFATFCMDMQKVDKEDPRTNIALQKYLDLQENYRNSFSYEALAGSLWDEEVIVEEGGSDEEEDDSEKIYVCPSNTLIFGEKQGKPLIKKFYLNKEYKRHFEGKDSDVREMLKIYKEIGNITKEKIEVMGEKEVKEKERKKKEKKQKHKEENEI